MKKVLYLFIVVIVMASVFSLTAFAELSGKITVAINNGQKVDLLQADADEFMKQHPGTEIEIEYVEKEETLMARLAANEMADISHISRNVLPSEWPYFVLPLDDIGFSEDNLNFYDAGVVDGHLYTITQMVSFSGVVYNKQVFKDAGIDDIPSTLDEFYAACEKIKAIGVVPFATNFRDKWPLGMYLMGPGAVAMSGDANYTNELVNKDKIVAGANLQLLEFLKSVVDKGYAEPELMSTNWGAFTKDIGEGKYAMSYLGSWFPPQTSDVNNIGMFPLPGSKGVPMNQDWRYAIAKNTDSPELAKAYFEHLFLDGAFYPIMGYTTPLKGITYSDHFIQELTSYGIPSVEVVPDNEDFTSIRNALAADGTDIAQEYILSDDVQSVIDKYNNKWVEAKNAAGL